ncbi:MAG TPA: UDP-3-O-(3-hydroxymyristoyl)glucosamine N-acyltransferase [Bacteroidales bacterium]|nr:UDP-3-O-(3-hydroxymyristoyl)glucosamine N-acyltransferase [Bacteroidales bacterium]
MKFTANDIAQLVGGKVEGNPEVVVSNISKIEEGKPGTLSFLANPKYTPFIYSTNASVVLVNNDFKSEKPVSATLIRTEDAYSAFAKLLQAYQKMKEDRQGIAATAIIPNGLNPDKSCFIGDYVIIEEGVTLGKNVKIYPQSYIGANSQINDNTTIYTGVKIYPDTKIGKECTIHSGTVIGSDGFGFAPQQNNNYEKIPQIGNVIIEDFVEIGSNCTIDRATMGSTVIRKGVKLDNLIQVAHNVEIGENTVIAAQSGISGSTKVGKNNMFGGQVGLSGHIETADDVKIGAQSGIASSIKEKGLTVLGSPAFDISKYKRSILLFKNLPKLMERLGKIEQSLKENK